MNARPDSHANGHPNGHPPLDEAAMTHLVSGLLTAMPGEPAAPGAPRLPDRPPGPEPDRPLRPEPGLPGPLPADLDPGSLAALAAEAIKAAEALASTPFPPILPDETAIPGTGAPAPPMTAPPGAGQRRGWDMRVPVTPPAIPAGAGPGAAAQPVSPAAPAAAPAAEALPPGLPVAAPGPQFYFIGPPAHAGSAPAGPPVPGGPAAVNVPGVTEVPGAPAVSAVPGVAGLPAVPAAGYDVEAIRRDFPILAERIGGHRLIWLDNAATTQKPQEVIDRLARFYARENSNVHRGAHTLAARATEAYEDARSTVASFLGAPSPDDIVFVRGTTEAINLVAQSWGRSQLRAGDEIVVSWLEHHANIVPWQMLAQQTGARLRVIPVDDRGQILLEQYRSLLTERTRLVAVAHVSNALGTVIPVREVIGAAHAAGARVLVDGAQAVAHATVDVRQLDADFYVFSGHKVYGPDGIGALYGKPDVLDVMPPWQGGGNMIREVTFERTTYQPAPARFEAGTPSVADAAALASALAYVERIGRASIARYEGELCGYATRALAALPGLRLVGTAPGKAGILSFVLDGYRPEDVGSALNAAGIAVRAGHHCAQPILRRFGLTATVRAALALYNTRADVDALAGALGSLIARRAA